MRNPDRIIRKSIEKHFKFRGQECICLTKEKFEKIINDILFDIARYGYHRDFLETYMTEIHSRIAPIDWAFNEAPPPMKLNQVPIQIKVEPIKYEFGVKNDGYDSLRRKEPEVLKWKQVK